MLARHGPSNGFRTSWDKAFKRAGLGDENLHFHDLRGTAVTRLALSELPYPRSPPSQSRSNDPHGDLFRFVFSGDLLNQSNNGPPELSVFDVHVGFREREPVRRGEEAGDIVARLVQYIGQSGCTFEKEGDWDLLN